jgi:hypothetical protein
MMQVRAGLVGGKRRFYNVEGYLALQFFLLLSLSNPTSSYSAMVHLYTQTKWAH